MNLPSSMSFVLDCATLNITGATRAIIALGLTTLALTSSAHAQSAPRPAMEPPNVKIDAPPVIAPPESFFKMIEERVSNPGRRSVRRDNRQVQQPAAEEIANEMAIYRAFYQKYIDVKGLPVAAHAGVADLALQRTYEIVTRMLAGRPDILHAMAANRIYLIVIGKNQVYTDMPEYRNHPNPAFQNERVRGTGGNPTSFGEENLLSLPLDRYDDESIGVHEFCHTIDSTLRLIDPTWNERKTAAFRTALEKGLWRNSYAGSNPGEFWAEVCQSYFDCNRVNNWNHGPIGRREQLKAYDPETFELVRSTFNLKPEQDWRYSFLQTLPTVTAPPPNLKVDPWYTKFSWAREFTVLGRGASDASLLQANDTIRRMFTYRHDILKALIAGGVKVVVLGRNEKLSDLPEYNLWSKSNAIDPLCRTLDYTPETKLLVVAEENVLADPRDPNIGANQVIRLLATALYHVTATRPVDPNWEKRGSEVQQYELRVGRLDINFDTKLTELFGKATNAGKWKGTAAVHNRAAYWTEGVLAYFDALGQDAAPHGAAHPINTREALAAYDPDLHALVHETMAYDGHVDWRYTPYYLRTR